MQNLVEVGPILIIKLAAGTEGNVRNHFERLISTGLLEQFKKQILETDVELVLSLRGVESKRQIVLLSLRK